MKLIARLIYDIGVYCYAMAIYLSSLLNNKAKKWIAGRKNIFAFIEKQLKNDETRMWVHCASLGEFEQGRPVIEQLKRDYPQVKIILTFFSPSGYEVRKNYAGADYIFYLPLDTKQNAYRFLQLIQPWLVIFVKYEFWYHYLDELHQRKIPSILISASFREKQSFFRWYGKFFQLLNYYDHLFVQNNHSRELINKAGIFNVTVSGDTRFDRVVFAATNAPHFPLIENFLYGKKALIAGSTWPEDEKIIAAYYHQSQPPFPLIIAPHEIDDKHIEDIEQLFERNTIRYSQLMPAQVISKRVLIIDNIGMLASLYQYGVVAWIGGGFNTGIHNILEAAVFGLPVAFGPKYHKFYEALTLMKLGGAFCINNLKGFSLLMEKIADENYRLTVSKIVKDFVYQNVGATDVIMQYIQENRFLTIA
jgi:3-deoxy-D-manno-octulosonic-acid transferase